MNRMNKLSITIIIVSFIGGIFYVQSEKKKELGKRKFLIHDGGFSIGTFESRNYSNGRTYSVSFSYTIEKKEYRNGDSQCLLDSPKAAEAFTNNDLAKRRDMFMVLYDKTNPEKSIIRLDYPIKDSLDFKKIVMEFEQMRKQKN